MSRLSNSTQRTQRRHAHARMPAHQRVDADREHRAHDVGAERLADADRVRDDEVVLQLFEQRAVRRFRIAARQLVARAMRAEQLVGVAAEAGRHAVDRLAALDLVGEEIRRALHARELRLVERDLRAGARDRDDVIAGQAVAVEKNRLHGRGVVILVRKVFRSRRRTGLRRRVRSERAAIRRLRRARSRTGPACRDP